MIEEFRQTGWHGWRQNGACGENSREGTPKHVSDALGDALVDTLGTLAAGEKPFYLQFHTYAVHTPVQARPDLRKAAAQQARDRLDADYLGFIAGVDENIGRLLKALEDPNGDGDTTDSIRKDTGEPAGPPPMP